MGDNSTRRTLKEYYRTRLRTALSAVKAWRRLPVGCPHWLAGQDHFKQVAHVPRTPSLFPLLSYLLPRNRRGECDHQRARQTWLSGRLHISASSAITYISAAWRASFQLITSPGSSWSRLTGTCHLQGSSCRSTPGGPVQRRTRFFRLSRCCQAGREVPVDSTRPPHRRAHRGRGYGGDRVRLCWS